MQEGDFIARIVSSPTDAAARLVYADWLEERGDERCEYLRLEHQFTGMSTDDEGYVEVWQQLGHLAANLDFGWIKRVGMKFDLILDGYGSGTNSHGLDALAEILGSNNAAQLVIESTPCRIRDKTSWPQIASTMMQIAGRVRCRIVVSGSEGVPDANHVVEGASLYNVIIDRFNGSSEQLYQNLSNLFDYNLNSFCPNDLSSIAEAMAQNVPFVFSSNVTKRDAETIQMELKRGFTLNDEIEIRLDEVTPNLN